MPYPTAVLLPPTVPYPPALRFLLVLMLRTSPSTAFLKKDDEILKLQAHGQHTPGVQSTRDAQRVALLRQEPPQRPGSAGRRRSTKKLKPHAVQSEPVTRTPVEAATATGKAAGRPLASEQRCTGGDWPGTGGVCLAKCSTEYLACGCT